MTNFLSREENVLLTSEYMISNTEQIDLTKLLSIAMDLNTEHDQMLQETFDTIFIKENQTWVITQYQIDVQQDAVIGDTVTIDTRIIDFNQFFITRRYSVSKDEALLYEVFVQFAGIDIEKRRIVRLNVSEDLPYTKFIDSRFAVNLEKIKRLPDKNSVGSLPIEIEETDIDVNNHVNNLVYLRWAFQIMPQDIIEKFSMSQIKVKYDKEILPEDEVELLAYRAKEEQLTQHIIYNKTQDKVASIIQIKWKKK